MSYSLSEAISIHLADYKPSTARSKAYPLRNFAAHMGDDFPIDDITPIDVKRYMHTVKRRPSITSDHTYNRYIRALRRFFNWCVEIEIIDASPMKETQIPVSKQIDKEKAMSEAEFAKLLDYAKWHPRLLALCLFLNDTGIRRKDLAALTKSQVFFDVIVKVFDKDQRLNVVQFAESKTGEHREVVFGDYAAWALRRHWQSPEHVGLVAFSKKGEPLTASALAQYFRRACIAAGIRSLGPHSVRHKFGHEAVQKYPLSVASRMIGHRSEMTTAQSYSPKSPDHIIQATLQMHAQLPPELRILPHKEELS